MMTTSAHRRTRASLIFNLLIVVFTIAASAVLAAGNLRRGQWTMFNMFTTDSNILMAVVALIALPYNVRALRAPEFTPPLYPGWLNVLKLAGTTAVMLTFAVVLFFLLPVFGPVFLYTGTNFFMHLTTPLLAMITFLCFERDQIRWPTVFFALIPTAIYALVYLYEVAILGFENGGWMDYYMLYHNGNWLLPMVLMLGVTLLLACLLLLARKRITARADAKSRSNL